MQTVKVVCAAVVAIVLYGASGSVPLRADDGENDTQPDATLDLQQRVMLPLIKMQPTPPDTVAAQGRLTMGGSPLVNTPFVLQSCPDDPNQPPLRVPGRTDAAGEYYVIVPLGGASSLAVSLVYPADPEPPVRGTLANFESSCVGSEGRWLYMPAIDLGGIELALPAKGEEIDMPILFSWQIRSHPADNEMYQVIGSIQYNCRNCAPVEISAAALPFPSTSIQLECVHAPAGAAGDVVSGEFQLMLSNDVGVGFSEVQEILIGQTVRC